MGAAGAVWAVGLGQVLVAASLPAGSGAVLLTIASGREREQLHSRPWALLGA